MAQQQQPSWLRKNRQYVIIAAATTAGAIAAYKVYRSEHLKATQKALQQAADVFANYSGAAASAGQIVAVLSEDIRQFLEGDADELPRSLVQLGKLARSRDVQDTLAACISSAVKGMLATSPPAHGMPAEPSVVDKVIEAVLSDRGHSLLGLAVRTAAQTSSETFCNALRQGVEAALSSNQNTRQQQQQQGGSAAAFSPPPSPLRQQQHSGGLHPAASTLVSVLSNPQVLNLIDNLVSTTVGSAVGAYVRQAGQENMFTSMLDALAKPGNKDVVIEVMSSVSAAFCREMAAACVAPAATVASRPPSRLDSLSPQQQLVHHTTHSILAPAAAASAASSPMKPLHHSHGSQGTFPAAMAEPTEDGSEPSTPQSGPSTPEPSVAADPQGSGLGFSMGRSSFAGSAVAGLILRRNSFPGLGGGWGSGSSGGGGGGIVDPAALGPMSTLVSLFVQAARFQEFRSLMVDVSRSSTREFVLSLLPASWSLSRRPGDAGAPLATAALTACLYRVYTTMSVLLFLMLYALGPKTMLEGGISM